MTVLATSMTLDSMLIGVLALVLVAPIAVRIARGRFDVFEPIVLFSLAYGVMFVARPTAMVVDDRLVFNGPRRALDVSATFSEMLVLALVGGVAFVVGYGIPVGGQLARAHRRQAADPNYRVVVTAAFVVGCLGLFAFALYVGTSEGLGFIETFFRYGNTKGPGASSSWNYAEFMFQALIPATLVLATIGFGRRNKLFIAAALCFAAMLLLVAVPTGSRITLLPLIGGAFVLYYLRRQKRPSLRLIIVLAMIGFFASVFLSDLRGRASRDETVIQSLERSTSRTRLANSLTNGPDAEMAPALAAALSVIPDRLAYAHGGVTIGDLVVRPIPRSLWHDKPLTPKLKLTHTIWPVEYSRHMIHPEYSTLVYFFWDFGVFGVIIGLAALGLLARYVYEYLVLNQERAYAQVLYALSLWLFVIALRDGPVDAFVRAVFVVAPVWFIFLPRHLPVLTRTARAVSTGEGITS
jgi:hypothetical protein